MAPCPHCVTPTTYVEDSVAAAVRRLLFMMLQPHILFGQLEADWRIIQYSSVSQTQSLSKQTL